MRLASCSTSPPSSSQQWTLSPHPGAQRITHLYRVRPYHTEKITSMPASADPSNQVTSSFLHQHTTRKPIPERQVHRLGGHGHPTRTSDIKSKALCSHSIILAHELSQTATTICRLRTISSIDFYSSRTRRCKVGWITSDILSPPMIC